MRVLLFSNWFTPIVSGSSFYTSSLAQALYARGHRVIVVTLDWGTKYTPDVRLPFPVYRLPVIKFSKLPIFYGLELMGLAFTPSNWRRLKMIVEQHQPDIIHHVNHIFDSTFLSTVVAHSANLPVVGSITTPVQHQNPGIHRLMSAMDWLFLGWLGVRHWDGIVSLDQTVHEYVGQLYGKLCQQKSVVIPFGVRTDATASYNDRSIDRLERAQILMVGHIHPFRNPVQLVRAMPRILQVIPEARLVLAGRVDLREPVEVACELGLSNDQVVFLGETPHDEVILLMQTSHVFASWVTGPYKGLGTAPMEAMLCETPVVNDLPENLFGEDGLRNGENIVLVNSRDPQSIAEALIRLLQDPTLRHKIGAGGRRFVLEHLSWDRIACQMEQFYAQILSEKRAIPRAEDVGQS